MKKFLVLCRAAVSAREQMTQVAPEQARAGVALWASWMDKNGGAVTDIGAPLDSGKKIVAGSVADSDTTITGFSIVQSETLTGATKLLHDHPHFHTSGGSIEVLEFLPSPGI